MSNYIGGRIDRERIGMAGHSFGAATTVYLAGAKVTLPGSAEPRTFGDDRIDAFLALSPQGPGRMGLAKGSWAEIRAWFRNDRIRVTLSASILSDN